jgi:hypothetical protein
VSLREVMKKGMMGCSDSEEKYSAPAPTVIFVKP